MTAYSASYEVDGKRHAMTIHADSLEEAEQKVKYYPKGQIDGVKLGEVPFHLRD